MQFAEGQYSTAGTWTQKSDPRLCLKPLPALTGGWGVRVGNKSRITRLPSPLSTASSVTPEPVWNLPVFSKPHHIWSW